MRGASTPWLPAPEEEAPTAGEVAGLDAAPVGLEATLGSLPNTSRSPNAAITRARARQKPLDRNYSCKCPCLEIALAVWASANRRIFVASAPVKDLLMGVPEPTKDAIEQHAWKVYSS